MENLVKQRKRMNPVRMEFSRKINKKLIAEIREKIRPESFGEQCNSLDVIYAMLQLIDEQPKVGEWIPCSERLPEEVRAIEVTMYDGSRAIGHYYKRLEAWFDSINDGAIDVIAWKEPSEPWEGGKE